LGGPSVDQRLDEIIATPVLLKNLALGWANFTTNAIGRENEIAARVVEGGGDYVLAIKGNHHIQPGLW
jgi:predicted transposase YbfD/YdcC